MRETTTYTKGDADLTVNVVKSYNLNCRLTHVCEKSTYTDMQIVDSIESKVPNYIGKPDGMWLSVNNSWEKWCMYYRPDWFNDKHISAQVSISPRLSFLSITSASDANSFIDLFVPNNKRHLNYSRIHTSEQVEWDKVYRMYDGIYFANYHDVWFNGNSLFFSWDVDCVCLFRAKQAGLRFTGYEESAEVRKSLERKEEKSMMYGSTRR